MTIYLGTPAEAQYWCREQRKGGQSVGFVPTMGALHDGHRSLVERAVAENGTTCASIFVNPLQFNNREDLDKYPRSLEEDLAILDEVGCKMAFTGSLESFFPEAGDADRIPPVVPLPAIAGLEAAFRPGHMEGVQAIVERLFRTVGPCRAYFGEKDFQQSLLVRQVAAGMNAIEVVVCPTVRESGGLAMSSRNRRLDAAERELALALVRALRAAAGAWHGGQRDPEVLEELMRGMLSVPGITTDYAAVRDPENWTAGTPAGPLQKGRALVAAWVGGIRLIDNLDLDAAGAHS